MMAGILSRFTLRSLRRNRTRTIVSIVGIVLSCALITAVFTTVSSLERAMERATVLTEGSWTAFALQEGEADLDPLRADERVGAISVARELGEAKLGEIQETHLGSWLALRELPVAAGGANEEAQRLSVPLKLSEGRLPTAEGELVLSSSMRGLKPEGGGVRADETLALGSRLELDLGRRTRDGRVVSSLSDTILARDHDDPEFVSVEDDQLSQILTRSYTVVGFYETGYGGLGTDVGASYDDQVAFVSPGGPGSPTASLVWASASGFSNIDELESWAKGALGNDVYLHNNLLRYQGVYGTGVVWKALWEFAATLACVIAVASVSLIYNAFAISVAERTRQFGLLSSMGASRRQLRRAVFGEALMLGLVGIPLGVLVGVAGVAVTLRLTQEGFDALLNAKGVMGLHVSAPAILATIAFSLLVLVVSAWLPALRASHVSAIDAIRQTQDVHVSRGLARRLREGRAGKGLFGMPGILARRNLTRSSSKGRVIVASLAVSVALMVTGGYLAQSLSVIVSGGAGGVDAAVGEADLIVSYYSQGGSGTLAEMDGYLRESQLVFDAARRVEGASDVRSYRSFSTGILLPPNSLRTDLRPEGGADDGVGGLQVAADGSGAGWANVVVPDSESWRLICEAAGVDESTESIAVNRFTSYNEDGSSTVSAPLATRGEAVLVLAERSEQDLRPSLSLDRDGRPVAVYYRPAQDGDEAKADRHTVPLDEVSQQQEPLRVAALLDEMPEGLRWMLDSSIFPTYIVSPSAYERIAGVIFPSAARVGLNVADSGQAAENLDEAMRSVSLSGDYHVVDIAGDARSTRLALETMTLFCLLFSLILVLIAIANVFNTLSNSMLLRTREFAMLRSVGMGPSAFRRMVVCECASYALRGLAWGLALALTVSYFLYRATELVQRGIGFSLPWAAMGAACLASAAVLGISVAFALHKGHASNVVEALRTDAI